MSFAQNISNIKKTLFASFEKYLFLIVVVLNSIPVFWFRFFPTLDGPAHLYNSNLINSLLFDRSGLSAFFSMVAEPVPNWTGHFVLSFINLFLPAFIAEKCLLLAYMFALPYAFRKLIITVSPHNKLFSYFIFPFCYSFTFLLGFYNFSIALCFLFFTLHFWLKNQDNLSSFKVLLKLFLLITATYFSHLFVFAILGLLIGIQLLISGITQIINQPKEYKNIIRIQLKKTGFLTLASSLCLCLSVYYFASRPASANFVYMNKSVLWDWLIHFDFLNTIEESGAKVCIEKLFYVMAALLLLASFNILENFFKNKTISFKNQHSFLCFLGSSIVLFLYFYLPESDDYTSYISIRLALLFYLFCVLWLSIFSYSKRILITVILIFLAIHFKIISYRYDNAAYQNSIAKTCERVSDYLLPNKVVLPINYSEDRIQRHFSNYLGIDKPVVILENYEANTGYFPVAWNENQFPNLFVGNTAYRKDFCLHWKTNTQNPPQKIDYIFILGKIDFKPDECRNAIKKLILENYHIVYKNEVCGLYQLNTPNN